VRPPSSGMFARHALADRAHLGVGLRRTHAGFQPGDDADVTGVAVRRHVEILVDRGTRNVAGASRHPEFGARTGRRLGRDERPEEVARHHGDHEPRTAVQRDRPADDRRIAAEPARPQPVAEHDGGRIRAAAVKRVAEERTRAEHVEERGRHAGSLDRLGLAGAGERVADVRQRGGALEARRLAAEVEHPARPHRVGRTLGRPVPQEHEPAGVGERQRPQERRIDDAEDGRVGADAQREREDRHGRESGRLAEPAHRVRQVLSEIPPHALGHGGLDGRAARRLGGMVLAQVDER
jgi:hypothetical protein